MAVIKGLPDTRFSVLITGNCSSYEQVIIKGGIADDLAESAFSLLF
jgi:hypothetical protein